MARSLEKIRADKKALAEEEKQALKDAGSTYETDQEYWNKTNQNYEKEREKSGAMLGIAFAILCAVAAGITGEGWLVVVIVLVMVFLSVKGIK